MRRTPAVIAACLLIAIVAGTLLESHPGPAPAAGLADGRIRLGGSDAASSPDVTPRSRPRGVLPVVSDRSLARAYAAVGAAEAGDPSRIEHLDALARERLDDARHLLQDSPLTTTRALTSSTTTSEAPGSAAGGATGTSSNRGSSTASISDAARTGTGEITDRAQILDLAHAVDPAVALRDTPNGPVLEKAGLWAKTAFDPQLQRQVVVTDGCRGGYAVALYADDYSTIRLDGGLVVPGRYYLVDGSTVITGQTRCSIDIRPLASLPAYAVSPARPPQGNG